MIRRAYGIIVACFFTVAVAYGIRYAYGMLLPEMLPALGISKAEAGVIFAVYFFAYTLFAPVLGTLSDLFNYRLIIPVFTAVLSAGAFLMAFAGGVWQACLFFSLAGLGHAACWAPVAGLVSKWVPDDKRGTALSFVTMGVALGIYVVGMLIPVVVAALNWQAGWKAMGLVGFAVAVLDWVLVRNPESSNRPRFSAREHAVRVGLTYKRLFRSPVFWTIGIAYLLVGFNVLVPFTFLPIYARESLNLAYATSTRFVAVIALAGIVGQLTLGTLSDKVGRVRVMILCSIIMGVGCLGMLLSNSAWRLYFAVIFYGLGYGAVWPVYAAAASDFFPKSETGSVVGLWTMLLGIGSIVSPVICGWSVDKTGGYSWAFMMGMSSGLLSVLILTRVSLSGGENSVSA